jgi:preprotein translocase subunit SecG
MQMLQVFMVTLFIVICVLLIVVVLLQKGRGGGLGAAFGGVGSTAFGTKTGDVFTWVTIVLTALFVLLSIATTVALRPEKAVAARPEFIPPQSPITVETSVSIAAPGVNVSIHYTVDGSEPTEQSPKYEKNPVMVKPGTMLQARTYQPGRHPSPATSAFYGPQETETQPAATTLPSAASMPALPASGG